MTAALCFPCNSMKFVSTAVLVRHKVLLTSLEPSHSLSFFNFFSVFTSHNTQCIEKRKKKHRIRAKNSLHRHWKGPLIGYTCVYSCNWARYHAYLFRYLFFYRQNKTLCVAGMCTCNLFSWDFCLPSAIVVRNWQIWLMLCSLRHWRMEQQYRMASMLLKIIKWFCAWIDAGCRPSKEEKQKGCFIHDI